MESSARTVTIAEINELAASFGQTVAPAVSARLAAYVQLLLRWNVRINLTGARDAGEILRDHLPDSFALSALVPDSARVVDVGSGGGLPALPFALLRPEAILTLVEPRAKRVAFLRTAVRELGLQSTVVAGRMEDLSETFAVAGARATFPPEEWWRKGQSLVAPGGQLVFFLNDPSEIPFPSSAPHRRVTYRAGSRNRVAVALAIPPRD
jgi:16S rRNA (guanine527-N7)-methyltransferase